MLHFETRIEIGGWAQLAFFVSLCFFALVVVVLLFSLSSSHVLFFLSLPTYLSSRDT
jgi:hypothetical protein